jgi:hypothetical protein
LNFLETSLPWAGTLNAQAIASKQLATFKTPDTVVEQPANVNASKTTYQLRGRLRPSVDLFRKTY